MVMIPGQQALKKKGDLKGLNVILKKALIIKWTDKIRNLEVVNRTDNKRKYRLTEKYV